MNKKSKFQLEKLTKETFTGTQVGVLLEDIDHKLSFIGESYNGVVERMDMVENRMNSMETKMDRMGVKLDATFEAVGDIKSELSVMKEKNNDLDQRIVVLEKRATV